MPAFSFFVFSYETAQGITKVIISWLVLLSICKLFPITTKREKSLQKAYPGALGRPAFAASFVPVFLR